MQNLIQKIIDWANDRNLINGSTPTKQGLKLMSEYGELCDSIAKNDLDGIKDGIGDVVVVAIIIATQHGTNVKVSFDNTRYTDKSYSELGYMLLNLIDDMCFITEVYSYSNTLANNFGLTLEQCLQHAYNEIKDRKGVMYKGVFIKESDPRYERVIKELSNE